MSEGITFGDATVDGVAVSGEEYIDAVAEQMTEEELTAEFAPDEVVEFDDPQALAEKAAELTLEEQKALINEYFPLPEDFPTEDQIKDWESEFGRLRIHRIAPNEAYVVRALNRAEFRQYLAILKKKFAGVKDPDAAEERMVQEELLVERCTLYPAITASDVRGERNEQGKLHKIGLAGTVSILAYDIQEISNLVDNAVGPFEEI